MQLKEMLKAAQLGDSAKVSLLLSQGVQPDFANALGMTPLLTSAAVGNVASCEVLIAGGSDLNAATLAGYTALHFAARRGDILIAQMLIGAGADVNKVKMYYLVFDSVSVLICSICTILVDPFYSIVILSKYSFSLHECIHR